MNTSDSPALTGSVAVSPDIARRGVRRHVGPHVSRNYSTLRRSFGLLALLCVALVIVADRLFYDQPLGWTGGLFAALLAVGVLIRNARGLRVWAGRITLLALAGLVLALVEHPGPLRITMALLALASLAAINHHGWTTSASAWIARWFEIFSRAFVQLPTDIVWANRWTRTHGGRAARALRTFSQWSIPVLLSLVFIGLFALANPVVSTWVERASNSISRVFTNFFEYVSVSRMLLWAGFAAVSWSLLRGRCRWPLARKGVAEQDIAQPLVGPASLDLPGLLVRCLILFNLVFAVEMAIDLATVLSNGSILPEGMTFRAYARRGAYPLVATALLAAGFVIIAFPSGKTALAAMQNSNAMRWARRLVCLWIAQNVLLTLSAMWRLWMYVEAFSLTRLRVAAAIWMALVAIGLITIIWRIIQHRTNSWLVRVNLVSLLATLYICCFFNFDSTIVWYDAQRCMEIGGPGPHLDREYLRSLGPEAIEPFQWLEQRTAKAEFAEQLRGDVRTLTMDLQGDLKTWQGWTWRRARIAGAID